MATNRIAYAEIISSFLESTDAPVDVQAIFDQFSVSKVTVKKHLKEYLDSHPSMIGRVIGFYPSSDTVIRLAEARLGPVSGTNVSEINLECKRIIDKITKPKHKQFLEMFLSDHLSSDGETVAVRRDTLVDYLYEEYVDFVHESDNGLVSIAGAMNEKILIRGLEVAGLVAGQDYRKTGKDSEADLQIEHRGERVTRILFCEIKSYAARERLLRGLQDIQQPEKIGVGFFNNASEFNPERTQTLLGAGPLAIYMPNVTHQQLNPGSLRQTTLRQDRLYRPLSSFVLDMVHFKDHGALPAYR